ncbi:MAG: CGNR zinc finger domain-containing protein [Pyrinomonadaceae bacterium]
MISVEKTLMTVKSREDKFKLIGGVSSLDFVNTVGGREASAQSSKERDYQAAFREERLDEYADLLAWGKKSGLLSESEVRKLERMAKDGPKAAEAVLKRAVKLREAVYRLFKAAIEDWPPHVADVNKLNEELLLAREHENLVFDKNGFRFEWKNEGVSLDKVLWMLAQSAAEILTSEILSRVKQCGGDSCGWLFLDTSRSGNRTWCDMKDCGNLAKVHRFRRKKAVDS